jgi:nitrate reductase NapE component
MRGLQGRAELHTFTLIKNLHRLVEAVEKVGGHGFLGWQKAAVLC